MPRPFNIPSFAILAGSGEPEHLPKILWGDFPKNLNACLMSKTSHHERSTNTLTAEAAEPTLIRGAIHVQGALKRKNICGFWLRLSLFSFGPPHFKLS